MKIIFVLTLLIIFFGNTCRADIFVVTHRDSPVRSLTLQQVQELYLARRQALPTGEQISVYDRSESDLRARFIESVLGIKERQFDAYWARLVFAGRVLPLSQAEHEGALIDQLSSTPFSIGYTDQPIRADALKTVLVIKEKQ